MALARVGALLAFPYITLVSLVSPHLLSLSDNNSFTTTPHLSPFPLPLHAHAALPRLESFRRPSLPSILRQAATSSSDHLNDGSKALLPQKIAPSHSRHESRSRSHVRSHRQGKDNVPPPSSGP